MSREQKLEQALRDFVTEIRAYQSPECEECEIIGPLLRQADAVLSAPSTEVHPDDKAVDLFADAMKVKLTQKRKEGRGGWWDDAFCNNPELSAMLREHVDKGDPLDVGNLAMMLHQRGERIAQAPKAEAVRAHPIAKFGSGVEAKPGLYRVHWKSGGTSLASIGMGSNGDRWIAPTNWLRPATVAEAGEWGDIERIEPIDPVPALTDETVERAVDAIEGELGGVSATREQARAILEYALPDSAIRALGGAEG